MSVLHHPGTPFVHLPGLVAVLDQVHAGLVETGRRYPFIAYGTDWPAFAHLVIAVLFRGPYRDPVGNIRVVQGGMIACAGVVPLALICGPIRGIRFWWQWVDMSFGFLAVVALAKVLRLTRRLEVALAGRADLVSA